VHKQQTTFVVRNFQTNNQPTNKSLSRPLWFRRVNSYGQPENPLRKSPREVVGWVVRLLFVQLLTTNQTKQAPFKAHAVTQSQCWRPDIAGAAFLCACTDNKRSLTAHHVCNRVAERYIAFACMLWEHFVREPAPEHSTTNEGRQGFTCDGLVFIDLKVSLVSPDKLQNVFAGVTISIDFTLVGLHNQSPVPSPPTQNKNSCFSRKIVMCCLCFPHTN
jgi:hypothetical protein